MSRIERALSCHPRDVLPMPMSNQLFGRLAFAILGVQLLRGKPFYFIEPVTTLANSTLVCGWKEPIPESLFNYFNSTEVKSNPKTVATCGYLVLVLVHPQRKSTRVVQLKLELAQNHHAIHLSVARTSPPSCRSKSGDTDQRRCLRSTLQWCGSHLLLPSPPLGFHGPGLGVATLTRADSQKGKGCWRKRKAMATMRPLLHSGQHCH